MPINQSDLAHFYGSEELHRASAFSRTTFVSDGVHYVRENGGGQGAYWLIDAIVSHLPTVLKHADRRLQDYQIWELKVKDGKGVLTCIADSGEQPVVTQKIPYTDFDLDYIKIIVERGHVPPGVSGFVIMLPSER